MVEYYLSLSNIYKIENYSVYIYRKQFEDWCLTYFRGVDDLKMMHDYYNGNTKKVSLKFIKLQGIKNNT